jgi:hypothetical protein
VTRIRYPVDTWGEAIISVMYGGPTEYSVQYSDARFREIRPGLSEKDVRTLLGEPLEIYGIRDNEHGWAYSRKIGDGSYRVRAVIFRGSTVIEIIHEYYVD